MAKNVEEALIITSSSDLSSAIWLANIQGVHNFTMKKLIHALLKDMKEEIERKKLIKKTKESEDF